MESYECMLILNPDLKEEEVEKLIEKVKEMVDKEGGKFEKYDQWGRKRLSYEIKKNTEGFYLLIEFKGGTKVIGALKRDFKLTDSILRHMITKRENKERDKK